MRLMGMSESNSNHEFVAPPVVARGEWHWEEVQLLPDGRCGVAVNGQPALLSSRRQPMTMPLEANISGQSHRTVILIDSVEVYRGVLHPQWWVAIDLRRSTLDKAQVTAAAGVSSSAAAPASVPDRASPLAVTPSGETSHRVPPG
jgi:hypothetical protein